MSTEEESMEDQLCREEYKPFARFDPIARIVRCGLPAGHEGDHDELIDGEVGSNPWPREPKPTDHTTAEGVDLDEAIEAAAPLLYEADRDKDETVPWDDFRPTDVASIVLASVSKIRATIAVRAAAPIIRRPVEQERDEALAKADDLRARLADTLSKLLDAATPGGAPMAEPKDLDEAVKAARAAFDSECSKIGRVLDDPDAAENRPWRAAVAAALDRVIVERDEARDDLAVANAHVGALRARMARLGASDCTCQAWPPEGPSPECEVHGAVRALNEANVELAALRARLADAERQRDQLERDIETIVADWHRQAADAERDALNRAADAVDAEFTSGMFVAEIFESWLRERAKAVKP